MRKEQPSTAAGVVFSSHTFAWPGPPGPWLMRFGFAEVRGRVECVSILVEPGTIPPSEALTRQLLRAIPFAAMVNEIREEPDGDLRRLVGLRGWSSLGTLRKHGLGLLATREAARARGRPRLDQTLIREVAQVYLDPQYGRAPTAAVARHFHVSRSTAAKWVRRARDHELIAPTTPGRVSGMVEAEGEPPPD